MQSPEHLDEGTIHAWLDGQLPPGEAAAVEAHAASCTACGEAVAEARGFVAGATRVLGALDAGIEGDVGPATVVVPLAPRRRRQWIIPSAAAATLFLASVTMLSVRESRAPRSGEAALSSAVMADSSVAAAPPAVATAVSPAPAPPPVPGSPSSAANMSGGGAAARAAAGADRGAAGAAEERRRSPKRAPREQTSVADAATAGQLPPAAPPAARMEAARVAAAPVRPDSISVQLFRRGKTEGSTIPAEMAKAGAPTAQHAAAVASCWAIVDAPAGVPERFVLDTTRAASLTAGQGVYRVRAGSTVGAGADIGSWQPTARDSVALVLTTSAGVRATAFAPPPAGQAARLLLPAADSRTTDTLVLRRVECER